MRVATNSYLLLSQLSLKLRPNIQYNALKECMDYAFSVEAFL